MRAAILTVLYAVILTACGVAPFEVERVDTTFSENQNAVYVGKNNRISTKSIAGGIHVDGSGVFVNPFVEQDAATGAIVALGLDVLNVADHDSITGGVLQLGTIERIVFRLADGELIGLATSDRRTRFDDTISYNSLTRSASYGVQEYAAVQLTPDQLQAIAAAEGLSVKIFGSRQSVVYEPEDLAASFQANLQAFIAQYVEPGLRPLDKEAHP